MSLYAHLAGVAGAGLGVLAGIIQWAFGDEIPEWTGDKLHPVQLGTITIALSVVALAAVVLAHRNPRFRHGRGSLSPWRSCLWR